MSKGSESGGRERAEQEVILIYNAPKTSVNKSRNEKKRRKNKGDDGYVCMKSKKK